MLDEKLQRKYSAYKARTQCHLPLEWNSPVNLRLQVRHFEESQETFSEEMKKIVHVHHEIWTTRHPQISEKKVDRVPIPRR